MYPRAIVILHRQISLSNASRLTSEATGFKTLLNLDVKFSPTRPGVGIPARNDSLATSWYCFLGQQYSFFNPIVSRLKTLKSQIIFGTLPLKLHKSSALDPSYNYDRFTIALFFIKLFFHKTDIS